MPQVHVRLPARKQNYEIEIGAELCRRWEPKREPVSVPAHGAWH